MGGHKKKIKVIFVLVIFVAVSITLGSIPSETLINYVGSDNAFILMFALGLLGGLTTFTGIPYHLILMNFASGGISPIGLGISTAIGVMIGDSTMFFIGKKVQTSLSPKILGHIDTIAKSLQKHPKLITPALITYGTFSPFSNDFVVASMSIMGYSYKRIILPLALGNIFFNIALAYLGLYAYSSIISLFY